MKERRAGQKDVFITGIYMRTFWSKNFWRVGWSHPGINDEGILSPLSMRVFFFF